MNPRIHHWLAFCLLWLAGVAYGQYNPSNPPEPGRYYTLTLQATPKGACTFNVSTPATYEAGTSIRLKATAASNYTFTAWMEGETVVSTTAQFDYVMPERDARLTAQFVYSPSNPSEPPVPQEDTTTCSTLYLSCSPPEGGSINVTSGKFYLIGATVSLKATAKTNFKFVNWTAGGEVVSTSAQFSYKIQRAGNNLVANFEYTPSNPSEPSVIVPSYTLTLQRSPSAGGTINVTSGNSYPKGEQINLVATPKSGYNFVRWTSDDKVLADTAAFTFTMPAHAVTITAEFEAIYNPANPGEPSSCVLASGSCGDNLTWILSCDYTLTIRGSGAMADYGISQNLVPWNEYKHLIRTVILPDDITTIGRLAFGNFARLTAITLPEHVTHIGDSAFLRCRRAAIITCKPQSPPVWGTDAFDEVNRLIPFVVPKGLSGTYSNAAGWREFENIHEEPYQPSVVTVYGQEVVVIESTDTLTTVHEQVDVFGNSGMVYTTIGNTLTLTSLDLNEEDSVTAAITYSGSESLTIVLNESSTIVADTVISSSADIVITGDGTLSVEGVVPILGVPSASVTFDSVTMHVRSLPSSAAVQRRIRGGKRLDETGGPALSGFGSTDFNKVEVSPQGAMYGVVTTGESSINALYVMSSMGEPVILTEFETHAVTPVATDERSATAAATQLDPALPIYNLLGMQVNAGYKGIVIQQGRKFLLH